MPQHLEYCLDPLAAHEEPQATEKDEGGEVGDEEFNEDGDSKLLNLSLISAHVFAFFLTSSIVAELLEATCFDSFVADSSWQIEFLTSLLIVVHICTLNLATKLASSTILKACLSLVN